MTSPFFLVLHGSFCTVMVRPMSIKQDESNMIQTIGVLKSRACDGGEMNQNSTYRSESKASVHISNRISSIVSMPHLTGEA